MSTPKQIAAARTNGALSVPQRRGDDPPSASSAGSDPGLAVLRAKKLVPVSIEGKRNSSRNSLRHGLLARTIVLEEESKDRFLELLHALIEEFQPSSATQLMLVETQQPAKARG